jgi:hypothetical protein
MASHAHELPLAKLNETFTTTMLAQKEKHGERMDSWDLLTNIVTEFEDDQGGEYVADITFVANGFTLLLAEIAFTQSPQSLSDKVERMIAGDNIVGIITVHIHESSQYQSPSKSSNISGDYMDYLTWSAEVGKLKDADVNAFKGIKIYGWDWIRDVSCYVEITIKAPHESYKVSPYH